MQTQDGLVAVSEAGRKLDSREEWSKLGDLERNVALALMICNTDTEAMRLVRTSRASFYRAKSKVLPILEEIKSEITSKAWQVLIGSVVKASQVMSQELGHSSARIRLTASKDILDRILGQPAKKIESRGTITVLGIEATKEQIEGLLHPIESSTEEHSEP